MLAAKAPPGWRISRRSQATVSSIRSRNNGSRGREEGVGHQLDELGVVVEHLLEMRDQPAVVDGVAGEAAAEMIVDAALRDVAEGDEHRFAVALIAGAEAGAPEHVEKAGLGKFRRPADSAVVTIHVAEQALGGLVEELAVGSRRGFGPALTKRLHEERAVLLDLAGLLAEDAGDLLEDRDEGRSAVTGGRRKVGAAPDRLAVGGQEHGERPSALLAQRMERRHVDLIDVGPFFAVDLDVHEKPVHHGCGCRILEAFMSHDVAPMAGGVAHREQDRLVAAAGLGEGFGSPGAPVDGVVPVLEQVGAGFVAEEVFGHLPVNVGNWRGRRQ